MTMLLYLTRVVGLRVLAVCLCLLVLGVGIDLIKTAPDLLEFGGGQAVVTYAALRVPAILATTLPIATLIGALLAMLALGQSSELAIIRCAGISTQRILLWLAPLAFALGAVHYLTVDRGIVWSNNALGAAFGEIADVNVPKIGRTVAVRDGSLVLHGKLASLDGTALSPFTTFQLDAKGNVTERTSAEIARYVDGIWTLDKVEHFVIKTNAGQPQTQSTQLAPLALRLALTPDLVLDLASKAKAIDSSQAAAVLAKEAIATRGNAFYAMQIERSRVAWAIPFVMLLIGMLGSYKLPRNLAGLRAAGIGFVLGICYTGVDGLFTSLGRLGVAPVQFAAYTPSFSFALIAIVALRQMEN